MTANQNGNRSRVRRELRERLDATNRFASDVIADVCAGNPDVRSLLEDRFAALRNAGLLAPLMGPGPVATAMPDPWAEGHREALTEAANAVCRWSTGAS